MLSSGSFLLTDIAHQLHEPSRKINIVDRFSKHLSKGTPKDALRPYLLHVKKWCPENVYKKGYYVTEATVLTNSNHPVSIFSEIHSSKEKDFSSINTVTFLPWNVRQSYLKRQRLL